MNGKMVEAIRLYKKMTLKEFADEIGYHYSLIGHVENGRRNVTRDLQLRVLKEFGDVLEDTNFIEMLKREEKCASL
jgi:antitoxin HigA-1